MTEPADRNLILAAAAASAAGPISTYESRAAWKHAVVSAANDIAAMALSKQGEIAATGGDAETARSIDVTLLSVEPEQKSKRAVVRFRADMPSKHSKDGTELVRTERFDSDPSANALAQKLYDWGQQGIKVRLFMMNKDKSEKNPDGFRTLIGAEPAPTGGGQSSPNNAAGK